MQKKNKNKKNSNWLMTADLLNKTNQIYVYVAAVKHIWNKKIVDFI